MEYLTYIHLLFNEETGSVMDAEPIASTGETNNPVEQTVEIEASVVDGDRDLNSAMYPTLYF